MQKAQIQKFQKLVIDKQCFYQNVQCVIAKNQEQKASGLLRKLGIKTIQQIRNQNLFEDTIITSYIVSYKYFNH